MPLAIGANETDPVVVVASEIQPCVVTSDESVSGYSIQLWQEIANELNISDSYELEMVDFATKMQRVEQGTADIAIGCISVSTERENSLDFSHPVAEGGFQAVSLLASGWFPTFSVESRNMLLVLLAFVVFFAHVMWLAERGTTAIHDAYFPGIFESVWFSIVTMSTVGYGDIAPRNWWGRISALALILSGVAAFGVIVSQFTADAIADPAKNPVTSVQDLQQYRVGTKEGTAADDFLDSLAVERETHQDITSAVDALRAGDIDILLYDSLVVSVIANRNADLVTTGPIVESHFLAIAMPQNSTMREPINQAILKFQANGVLKNLQDRWF